MAEASHRSPTFTYKILLRLTGAVILCVLCYLYFYKDIKLYELIHQLKQLNSPKAIFSISVAVILVPVNWLLESWKWRIALRNRFELKLWESFKCIMQGIALGIVTPARVGEYGGRVARLERDKQAFGAVATLICSLAQNLVNISFGIFAISLFGVSNLEALVNPKFFTAAAILLAIFVLIVFVKFDWILKKISSISILKDRSFLTQFLASSYIWPASDKWKILTVAVMRYGIYCLQYILVLTAFSIDITLPTMALGVMLLFSVQTLLPLTPILQFTIRGGLSIAILGAYSTQNEALIMSSYTIWLMNLLLPAIAGAILFFMGSSTKD